MGSLGKVTHELCDVDPSHVLKHRKMTDLSQSRNTLRLIGLSES